MNFIEPNQVSQIKSKPKNMVILRQVVKFLIKLADSLGIQVADILEVLELKKEYDPEKLQAKEIAERWMFFTDEQKQEAKISPGNAGLNFELIENTSRQLIEKKIRFENIWEKIIILFDGSLNDEDKPVGIYKHFLEVLTRLTGEEEEKLFNSALSVQCEIFKNCLFGTGVEISDGFFTSKVVKMLLKNTSLPNFLEAV